MKIIIFFFTASLLIVCCSTDCDSDSITGSYRIEGANQCTPFTGGALLNIIKDGTVLDKFVVVQEGTSLSFKSAKVLNQPKGLCVIILSSLPNNEFASIEFTGKTAVITYGKDGRQCASVFLRKQ